MSERAERGPALAVDTHANRNVSRMHATQQGAAADEP
jgi:endonuclease III